MNCVVTHGEFDLHILTNGKFAQHGYCVVHRETAAAIVIDPGLETRSSLLALVGGGMRIERIMLTHGHFDHVGAVQPLCEALGLTADAHEGDRALIRQAQLYGIRWERKLIPVPKRVQYFSDERRWEWSGGIIDTIAGPGHTQGSVSYHIGDMAFTGDTLFRQKVGPTFYPGADRAALIQSVERLLARLPGHVTLYAGHGRPWHVEAARSWWLEASHDPETFNIYETDGPAEGESLPGIAQIGQDA